MSSRQDLLQELAFHAELHSRGPRDGGMIATPIGGVTFLRAEYGMQPFHHISKPAMWITIQGDKWATVGRERYEYRPGQAFVVTVEVPCRCTIPDASAGRPFLGLVIEIDRANAQGVMEDIGLRPKAGSGARGAFVLDLSEQLLDCALRSVRLLDTPEAIPVLYPGILREICYWLLTGPGGNQTARIAMTDGRDGRIVRAIRRLRVGFRDPIRIEDLAAGAGMSPATFHRRFRAVASLSPLQYQKQLRLLEARRLLISGSPVVEDVAIEVGYESVSQFSREYARMFGESPRRDVLGWQSP